MAQHETLVVLDFGSQVTQLIARRVRELGVYAEILPYDLPLAELEARHPKGVILSGGPSSIYDVGAPQLDPRILELGVPVLGICYGLYAMVAGLGGEVRSAREREYGHAIITVDLPAGPMEDIAAEGATEPGHKSRSGCRTATRSSACPRAS